LERWLPSGISVIALPISSPQTPPRGVRAEDEKDKIGKTELVIRPQNFHGVELSPRITVSACNVGRRLKMNAEDELTKEFERLGVGEVQARIFSNFY
jgi:hypothetical protein